MEERPAEPGPELSRWNWASSLLEALDHASKSDLPILREAVVARLDWLEQEAAMERLTRRPGVRWSVDVECVNNLDHVRERQVEYLRTKLAEIDAMMSNP